MTDGCTLVSEKALPVACSGVVAIDDAVLHPSNPGQNCKQRLVWSHAHSSIRVQEGQPLPSGGEGYVHDYEAAGVQWCM